MSSTSKRLTAGSRVAIVGGGPAGCFMALYLLHYAGESGIHPEITIYQQRDFNRLGPKGCKGCAGVLSLSLVKNLNELDLTLPEAIIQNKIDTYTVHSPYTSISISNPEKGTQITSVYRGSGPKLDHNQNLHSFDGWLLNQAQRRGARVEYETVSQINLEPEAGTVEVAGQRLAYDLIVLAIGVNTKALTIVGLDYIPPKTVTMAQDELYAGTAQVQAQLGNTAHVFLIPHSKLIFGTLVPKGPFINASVLSRGDNHISVDSFLRLEMVRRVLPEHYETACGCRPRAVTGFARNYFSDRFVAVGDAVVSRLYKDGIGSALLTAREAAHTIIHHGISRRDFKYHYQRFCRTMNQDNRWGRRLFSINDHAKNSSIFLLAQHRLIGDEQNNMSGAQPFTKAAWGMFSGSYNYRSIAKMMLNPTSLVKFSAAILGQALGRLFHKEGAFRRRLYVGRRKVLILGSGFGGTYTLRHLVHSLNKNENVDITMVSMENYFLFSPLLHEVALGKIETRHITYTIRRLQWRDRFTFIQAKVQKIDLDNHKVATTAGDLDFDYLILSLGSIIDTSNLDSVGGDIFTLKTLRDSIVIRDQIIGVFERASIEKDADRQRRLLTFVVSGGGYIGVQLVAELRDFIFKNLAKYYKTINPDIIRIMLVEAESKIMAQAHPKIVNYAIKHLQRAGIEVRLNSCVTQAQEGQIVLNDTEVVATDTLIWVTGLAANPRIAELKVDTDSIGRVVVNQYMEVPGVHGVYAVGDCAHFKDPKSGLPIPPRAHTAVRQAKTAAGNILADIRGRDRKPFHYSNPGELITLGASKATLRLYGLRLYGFPIRLVWLITYTFLVTGTYNRTRIVTDWLLSVVFGRDFTNFRLKK